MLQEASVLGQVFDFELLQAVHLRPSAAVSSAVRLPASVNPHAAAADIAEEELEDALEEAARAGLIREMGRDSYGFDHALTQQALYSELAARRRQRLHVAAGEALERAATPPSGRAGGGSRKDQTADLLRHFLEGNAPERAVGYALLAGDRAEEVFAHSEAEHHYQTALDLAVQIEDASKEAEALEQLGRVARTLGRYDTALQFLDRAAERYSQVQHLEGQRRCLAQIGQVHESSGSFAEGIDRLQAALATLDGSGPSEGLAAIQTELAFLFFRSGRYAEQLTAAERACQLAREAGSDRLLAQAELARGYALVWTEHPEQFRPAMERVAALSEKIGDLSTGALALGALVGSYADAGELEQAATAAERALQIEEQLGDRSGVAFMTYVRGLVAYWSGAWDQATSEFERSLAIYREVGSNQHAMIPTFGLGMVLMGRGDWEAGSRDLEEHIAMARQTGDLRWLHAAEALLAERDILDGHAEAARTRLQEALDIPDLTRTATATVRTALAWALLELGDTAQASELITEAVDAAAAQGGRRLQAETLRVQGMVLTCQHRWEDARRSFESALSISGDTVYPCARARVLHEYGTMLAASGDHQDARIRLADAVALFRRLGAQKELERTQQVLALLDQG
jgi:tetratricopeptide (TPR) repeat protein